MAPVSVGPSLRSRLSGRTNKPLKIVTFLEDLPDPGVHHTYSTEYGNTHRELDYNYYHK